MEKFFVADQAALDGMVTQKNSECDIYVNKRF